MVIDDVTLPRHVHVMRLDDASRYWRCECGMAIPEEIVDVARPTMIRGVPVRFESPRRPRLSGLDVAMRRALERIKEG